MAITVRPVRLVRLILIITQKAALALGIATRIKPNRALTIQKWK